MRSDVTLRSGVRAALGLLVFATACSGGGGDDDGTSGLPSTGAGAGAVAGASGGGAGMPVAGGGAGEAGGGASTCVNTGELNVDCPQKQPITGDCAPKGLCCHRASNATIEATLGPDEGGALEYRVTFQFTRNHPLTLGADVSASGTQGRLDSEEQSLLWRFEGPRQGGEQVSGPGFVTIGQGRYNCDGTYSFYGAGAAPARPLSSDASRWEAERLPATVDASMHGPDRQKVKFTDQSTTRALAYTPFLTAGTPNLEWELVTQGFEIVEIDTEGEGRDCIGSRSGQLWNAGGTFETFTPLEPNSHDMIGAIAQSFCQFISFNVLPEGMKQADCTAVPRCQPGSEGCLWQKLPDSLCPTGTDEMSKWGCHLGAEGNPNMEADYPAELDCTPEAPAGVLDPDLDPTVASGQCCDPLGASTTLPACNAHRLVQSYVASAVEITDAPSNQLQAVCP